MTEDNELIEIMARAIYEAGWIGFSHPRLGMREATWDELGESKERERTKARAALTAYRNHEVEL